MAGEAGLDNPTTGRSPDSFINGAKNKLDSHQRVIEQKPPKSANIVWENIYNNESKIEDIQFSEDGHTAKLKDVLPGAYTIEFTNTTSWSPLTGTVKINNQLDRESTDMRNLALLHEAGHAVDYSENRDKYLRNGTRNVALKIGVSMCDNRQDVWPKTIPQPDPDGMRLLFPSYPWQKEDYGARAISRIYRMFSSINNLTSEDDLIWYRQQLVDRITALETKNKVAAERNAWSHAVNTLRGLRRKGINLYHDTDESLQREIEGYMEAYHFEYEAHTTDKHSFLPFDLEEEFLKKT